MFADAVGGREKLAQGIASMRQKYHNGSTEVRRDWWVARTYYKGYNKADTVKGRKFDRDYEYFMERPEIFMERAMNPNAPRIQSQDLVPSCAKFAAFVCGGHTDTVHDNALRKQQRALGTADAASRDVAIPAQRDKYTTKNRVPVKRENTTAFLRRQGELGCILPNDPHSRKVLPFRTAQTTHAFYVYELEKAANCAWAQTDEQAFLDGVWSEVEDFDAPDLVETDSDEDDDEVNADADDNADVDEQAVEECEEKEPDECDHPDEQLGGSDLEDFLARVGKKPVRQSSLYRYGNTLCGLKQGGPPTLSTVASLNWFNDVWRGDPECQLLVCREDLPFAKCTICVRQREVDIRKLTPEELIKHQKARHDHLKDVYLDKQAYYTHRDKARVNPERYLSIIIDGADQSKYSLPHFIERCHKSDATENIKMHLFGALVHGRGSFAYLIADHEEQGHNATINVLWKVLVALLKGGPLPPVLFLQLDNTVRQNKGQFLFGFLDLLVEYGVFERVYTCFLPVGHTHEDIDQMFSRIALALRYRNAFTPEDLLRVVRRAFKFEGNPPQVEYVTTWANFRSWMTPYTAGFMKGVTNFRHFRIFRSSVNRVVWVQACKRMSSFGNAIDPWRGLASDKTTHTVAFTSGYGIPDLAKVYQKDRSELPDALRRQDVNIKTLDALGDKLATLSLNRPIFTPAAVDACNEILQLFKRPAASFQIPSEEVEFFFGGGVAPGEVIAQQQQLGLSEPELCAYYIVRPPDGSKKPFWFGQVKEIFEDAGVRHARMRWFKPANPVTGDEEFLKSLYVPQTPTILIPKLPSTPLSTLQFCVRTSYEQTNSSGSVQSVKINGHDHANVQHYVNRFRHQEDMKDHGDEQVRKAALEGPTQKKRGASQPRVEREPSVERRPGPKSRCGVRGGGAKRRKRT